MANNDFEVSPPGDDYVGCYSDVVGDRVLTSVVTSEDLTPQVRIRTRACIIHVLVCGILGVSWVLA